jgi:hypothetical protein
MSSISSVREPSVGSWKTETSQGSDSVVLSLKLSLGSGVVSAIELYLPGKVGMVS